MQPINPYSSQPIHPIKSDDPSYDPAQKEFMYAVSVFEEDLYIALANPNNADAIRALSEAGEVLYACGLNLMNGNASDQSMLENFLTRIPESLKNVISSCGSDCRVGIAVKDIDATPGGWDQIQSSINEFLKSPFQ